MSLYRKNWVEVLKGQNFPGWDIGLHGQAIVIKVSPEKDLEAIKNEFPATIEKLSTEVHAEKEWTKFILYNGKSWFQYIIQ